jgi:hypothetical protein
MNLFCADLTYFLSRYQVEDFAVDNIYKVNLGIKICLDVVTCPVDEQVLDNALITKPTCLTKLKQDYKIKGNFKVSYRL